MKNGHRNRLLPFCLALLCAMGSGLHGSAEERVLPEGMTPKKLEMSVTRRFDYIDKRLLTGKSAQTIEESGNAVAIALLEQARGERDEVAALIERRQFEEAYWALQDLNDILKRALKLSWAKTVKEKKIKDEMESARIVNDAFFELAKKRGITQGTGGREAALYLKRAQKERAKGDKREVAKEFVEATEAFQASTRLLKKAVAIAKKRSGDEAQE